MRSRFRGFWPLSMVQRLLKVGLRLARDDDSDDLILMITACDRARHKSELEGFSYLGFASHGIILSITPAGFLCSSRLVGLLYNLACIFSHLFLHTGIRYIYISNYYRYLFLCFKLI